MATPMRKALITAFGDVSNISVVESTIPPPSKNEVQVQVSYAGFSGADVNMRQGTYPLQRSAPLTPGYCFAGRVALNGDKSSRFAPGTAVAALTTYDAQAERVNVQEKHLIPIPADLAATDAGMQAACALVLDWTTAYGMVHRAARVQAGQRVFIHGLSGAVGSALTILCLQAGAQVYGTASERNHAALREMGATPFVYTDKAWMAAMTALGGAHAVFDPLGFESWDESYAILAEVCDETGGHGVLVGYGGNKVNLEGGEHRTPWPSIAKLVARNLKVWSRKRTSFYYIDRNDDSFSKDLMALMDMVTEDTIKVPMKAVWDLETEGLRTAHASWGKIQGMGSLLIRVAKD